MWLPMGAVVFPMWLQEKRFHFFAACIGMMSQSQRTNVCTLLNRLVELASIFVLLHGFDARRQKVSRHLCFHSL
jgi:hypothetical protein